MTTSADTQPNEELLQRARGAGLQHPERFSASELEALLAALPGAQPVSAASPSSGVPSGVVDLGPVLAHGPSSPPGARPSRPPEPYQHNPFFVEPDVRVPASLGHDAVWVLAVEPERLFATWDASAQTRAAVQAGARPVLRVVSPDAAGHMDVEIDLGAPNWYLPAPAERVAVAAVLGLVTASGFQAVATSATVAVPPRHSATPRAADRVAVPYHLDRRTVPSGSLRVWLDGGEVQLGAEAVPLAARRVVAEPTVPEQAGLEPGSEAWLAAGWLAVLRGRRRMSWQATGPSSGQMGGQDQEMWELHIRGLRPAEGLPGSGVLASSHHLQQPHDRKDNP